MILTNIRFQFSARDSLSSTMIRHITRSEWSHVDTLTEDGRLLGARSAAVGKIPAGVQIRPFDYLDFSETKIVTISTTEEVAAAYWDFMLAQMGKPYDKSAYIAFVLNRDWRKDDKWDCSEYVARGLEISKFFKPLVPSYDRVAPCDLMLLLSAFTDCT